MKAIHRSHRKADYRFDPHSIAEPFGSAGYVPATNSICFGTAVFEIEKIFRKGGVVRRASLPLFGAQSLKNQRDQLRSLLHDLIVFTLTEDVDISFLDSRVPSRPAALAEIPKQVSNVCLFSGGVDSYAGLLLAKMQFKSVAGVFCAHTDQGRMIHIVRSLIRGQLSKAGVGVHELRVPAIGAYGYAQLRGFLYILSAAAWAYLAGARRLLVTECGPTMYQPRFSPIDSITMTTHPVVLRVAGAVMDILFPKGMEILTPFENLTKAEVIAISPRKAGLRHTHSCISQRFGRHDGTCYGCVIRRLAAIAAGVDDVKYDKNPIASEYARGGNLMSLFVYSYDLLTNYHAMETYEVESIEVYRKRDLFRRFALDNFAAVHRLVQERHRVRPSILQMYKDLIKKRGKESLETRLKDLAAAKFSPTF